MDTATKKLMWIFGIFFLIGLSSVIAVVVIQDTGDLAMSTQPASSTITRNSTDGIFTLYSVGTSTKIGYSINNGTTWAESDTTMNCDFGNSGRGALLVNSTDAIIIPCIDFTNDMFNVTVSIDSGTNWENFKIMDLDDYGVFQGFAATIDNDDDITVCSGVNAQSWLFTWNASADNVRTSWSNQTTAIAQNYQRCAIEADSTDRIHISLMETTANDVTYFTSVNPMNLGSEITVLNGAGLGDADHSMAIGSDDRVYIVGVQNNDGTDLTLYNTTDNGATWTTTEIPLLVPSVNNPDVIVDANNTIHVMATQDVQDIVYVNSTDWGATWSTAILLVDGDDDLYYPHMGGSKFPSFAQPKGFLDFMYHNFTGDDIYYSNFEISDVEFITNITVLLESPENNLASSSTSQTFVCSAETEAAGINIANVTFTLWDSTPTVESITFTDLESDASQTANESFAVTSLADDTYKWNCEYTDLNPEVAIAANNYSLLIDTVDPILNITNIIGIYSTLTVPLNYSIIETNPSSCVYSQDLGVTNTSFSSCGANATLTANHGDNTITVFVNDTVGTTVRDDRNFTSIQISHVINESTARETATELFSFGIVNGSSTLVSAIFRYNTTEESYTTAVSNGSSLSINKSYIIPLIDQSTMDQTFSWNATFQRGTDFANLSFGGTQTTERITFAHCNDSIGTPYINFTFKDENTDDKIKGRFNPAEFTYSLTDGFSVNRTLSYTNVTDQDSFAFCFAPKNDTLVLYSDIDYLNASVQQRNYINITGVTNDTKDQVLYLLGTADGIFVNFIVTNLANQPIIGASVVAERSIGGSFQTIESGVTDDSGSVTFFLNPDKSHRFSFSASGFDTLITTITPTQSVYTIILGTTVVSNETNLIRGVRFVTQPKQDVLANNTAYTFGFNITSSYFDLTSSGFTLANLSGYSLGSASCSTNRGCNSTLSVNTHNQTDIVMEYFWVVEGNTTTLSRTWLVSPAAQFESSWDRFKSDFAKFGESFGSGTNGSFTRAIIAFFIIMALTFSTAMFAGVQSRLAIVGMITAGTGVFDLLGWFPQIGPFPYFITAVMGLIFISFLVVEYRREF